MLHRIFAIALNTFRESIRDRILFAVAIFAIFLIASSVFLGSISLEQDEKIIKDISLVTIFILDIFIVIFVGANLIYNEIERKSFFMILPKPITKTEVLTGKFLGLGLTTFLLTFLMTLLFVGALAFKFRDLADIPPLVAAVAFGYIESLLVILVILLFSSFTSPVLAAVCTSALFFIGHSSSLLMQIIQKEANVLVKDALLFLYYLFPNFEKFNIRNDVIYGGLPSPERLLLTLAYAAGYGLFIFLLARALFARREY